MVDTGSALAREIQQKRPFQSARQEAALGLLKTVDVLRLHISRVLEPFGVTDQQYNVLRILRGAGQDGLPTLEIAERMIERAPGITRLIDRLETKGLVSRESAARATGARSSASSPRPAPGCCPAWMRPSRNADEALGALNEPTSRRSSACSTPSAPGSPDR